MRRLLRLLARLLVLAGIAAALAAAGYAARLQIARQRIRQDLNTPERFGKARLVLVRGVPVLHLYGSPAEMGAQHGTILKDAFAELGLYLRMAVPSDIKERVLARSRRLARNLPPDIKEELDALAQASGMDREVLAALNVTSRVFCSGLAVSGPATRTGGMIMGRNAEYFSFGLGDRASYVVVYHSDRGYAVASINFLGVIGAFTGVNEKGVAFGNMLVFNGKQPINDDQGVVVALAMRAAARTAKSARQLIERVQAERPATTVTVLAADPKQAYALELGPAGAVQRGQTGGVIAATNFFTSPGMHHQALSCPRYDSLIVSAADKRGTFEVDDMFEALRRAQIERLNIQSAVFDLQKMSMHVSFNRMPAANGQFTELRLDELFSGE